MKLAIIASVFVLVSCSSSYVGVRGGLVPTLQSGKETGRVQSSSNGIGLSYGATAGLALSNKIGIQLDPAMRTASLTQRVSYPIESGGTDYAVNAQVSTVATMFELPILLTSRRLSSSRFRTMFGVGPHFAFRTSVSGEVTGSAVGVTGPNAGSVSGITPVSFKSGSDDSILFGLSAMAAVDMVVVGGVRLRGDVRLQHDFSNDRMSAYEFAGLYGPYITAEYPQTRISIGVSLLLGDTDQP